LRALAEAGTKAVAILLANEFCLAIYELECAFGTGWNADSTAVTFLLINFYDFPQRFCCHWMSPYRFD